MDPDPGGPKTCGSGSETLLPTFFKTMLTGSFHSEHHGWHPWGPACGSGWGTSWGGWSRCAPYSQCPPGPRDTAALGYSSPQPSNRNLTNFGRLRLPKFLCRQYALVSVCLLGNAPVLSLPFLEAVLWSWNFSLGPAPTPAQRSRKSELRLRLQLQSRLRINFIRYLDNYLFWLEYKYFFTWIDAK